jgi:hypothetical protein
MACILDVGKLATTVAITRRYINEGSQRAKRLRHRDRRGVVFLANDHRRRAGKVRQCDAQIVSAEHTAGLGIGQRIVGKKHVEAMANDFGMLLPERLTEPAGEPEID